MTAGTMRRTSGIIVPHQPAWHGRLAAFVAAFLFHVSKRTWHIRWSGSAEYPESKGPVIYCVWHNRLVVGLASYNEYCHTHWPDSGVAALTSASRDGGILASVLEHIGVQPVRGSSSRRGPQALLEATTWMEKNYSFAWTPDGPRGPMYHVQDGIIQLAKLSGRPIIPISSSTRWKIRFNRTWDRFEIPLPFSRSEMRHGAPVWVPRDASDDECEQLRVKLEEVMRALTTDD
jgi:lysophospholipid acyltransferase (LPLAT)-like uncharacterized protein